MTRIILIGRILSDKLQLMVLSIFQQIIKFSTSSDYLKSTERNARSRVTTRKRRRHAESSMNCWEKKPYVRKITSERLKNRNYRILKQPKRHNSLNFHRLGTITWVITRQRLIFPWRSWKRSTCSNSSSSRTKSGRNLNKKWNSPRISLNWEIERPN